MLSLVHDRRIEDIRKQALVRWELFLQAGNNVAADRNMDLREGLLDHPTKCKPGEELHLGPDRDPDHIRPLALDRREHQLPAHIAVDIDLLVVQTGKDFLRDAGAVSQIALHGIEHDRRRVVCGRDVLHDFAKGVQRRFQLDGVVKFLAADDLLGLHGSGGQFHHVNSGFCLEQSLLIGFAVGKPGGHLLRPKPAKLHGHPSHDPDQEGVAEEEVVHLDVNVPLNYLMTL